MQAPVEMLPQAIEWILRTGNVTVLALGIYVARKMLKRLDRDEELRRDFPPHRHINGSIIYPREYQPARVDHLPVKGN